MILLKEDIEPLLTVISSYIDGLMEEMKGKSYQGHALFLLNEQIERLTRLSLRLKDAKGDNK